MAQDDKMKLGITLDVDANGTEIIDALVSKVHAMQRALRSISTEAKRAATSITGRQGTTSGTNAKAEIRTARDIAAMDRAAVAEFKRTMALKSRLTRQHAKELRAEQDLKDRAASDEAAQAKAAALADVRRFRERMRFTSAMGKLATRESNARAREEERSIASVARAETRRMQERAAQLREGRRQEAADTRRHESQRSRSYSDLRSGGSDMREGSGRVVRGAGIITAAGTAAAGSAARKGISTRMAVEAEETSISIFSGKTRQEIAEARKSFLDNESVRNGLSVVEGLQVFNEVLKAGIKDANNITGLIMKGASGLELNSAETTRLTALVDRNYGSKSTPALLKSALNAVAVSAKSDPTKSNEIVSGMRRGFGVMSTGNWTPEQLAAAVSGAQSVGIGPEKAGGFIGTVGKRLSAGASKFLGPKERKELNFGARELGFANAKAMASAYSKDSFNVFMSAMQKLKGMSPEKAQQVADAVFQTQWSDEALAFSQGSEGVQNTYKEVVDPKNANFLEEAATQRAASLQGKWNSTKSIIGRFFDAFGAGFEDILNGINDYFMDLNSTFDYGQVKSYVSEFMQGLKDSFGVSTWKELLTSTFGGNIGNMGAEIKAFAKGLGDGVQSIARMIRSVATVFGGGSMSAETLGGLTGKFVALTASLVILGPVLSILGGLASIIMGIAVAGRGLAGLAGLSGAVAAGAGAGLMRGLGLLLSRMFALTVVAEIGANRGVISTWMLDAGKSLLTAAVEAIKSAFSPESIKAAMKGLASELIPAPIERWLNSDGKLDEKKALPGKVLDGIGKPPVPTAPAERGFMGKAWDWIASSLVGSANASELTPAIQENTAALKANLEHENGFKGLIKKTSLSSDTPAQSIRTALESVGGKLQTAALSGVTALGGGSSGGGGPLSSSVPGSALNGGSGLSRRGILGGGGGAAASGPIRDRMKSVYNAYRSAGLSHESAKSFAAEIGRENDFNPKLMFGSHIDPHNGKRNAGMMSWQGDRATKLLETLRAGGHLNSDGSIKQTQESLNAQAKFSLDEMKNGALGAKGQRALGVLQNPNATHADRALALGDDVIKWRQHDPRYGSHANKRDRYYNQMEGVSSGASAGIGATSTSGQVLSQMQTLRRSGQVMNEQCVALAKAAVGATGSVQDWKKGESAELGNLKPGTPVATFLDRMGRQTAKYAGGGTGTPGANLDHAGVFQEYIKDAAGKNIGMRLAEQYKGSGGVKSKDYMFGKGFGEKNASNYSTIMGPDGNYLGGANNPMSRIAKQAEEIKSSGWRKGGQTGETPNAFGGSSNALSAPVRQEKLFNPGKAGGANTGNGGGGGGGNATIHINGQNLDAHSIANAVQRRWNENISRGTHDIDSQSL